MRVGLESETGGAVHPSLGGVTPKHEVGHGSWQAQLSLRFERRQARTVLAHSAHRGPLRVQRPFYPESDGTCHLYVLHPPGGVASGDQLHVDAQVEASAHALITTPGASKLYKTRGAQAQVTNQLTVADHGCLEWLPQETIAFEGAEARLQTHVELGQHARYAGWEIVCLGRPMCQEAFERGRLHTELKVSRAGKLRYLERGRYQGGDALLATPWGLGGAPVFGLFLLADERADDSWIEQVRASVTAQAGLFSVTLLPGLVLGRYIGASTLDARQAFEHMFAALRPLYAGKPAVPPRIWRT